MWFFDSHGMRSRHCCHFVNKPHRYFAGKCLFVSISHNIFVISVNLAVSSSVWFSFDCNSSLKMNIFIKFVFFCLFFWWTLKTHRKYFQVADEKILKQMAMVGGQLFGRKFHNHYNSINRDGLLVFSIAKIY